MSNACWQTFCQWSEPALGSTRMAVQAGFPSLLGVNILPLCIRCCIWRCSIFWLTFIYSMYIPHHAFWSYLSLCPLISGCAFATSHQSKLNLREKPKPKKQDRRRRKRRREIRILCLVVQAVVWPILQVFIDKSHWSGLSPLVSAIPTIMDSQ